MTKKTAKKKDELVPFADMVPGTFDLDEQPEDGESLEDDRDQEGDVPALVMVRSINNHRIHLGQGRSMLPGEAAEVSATQAALLVARGMAELMSMESR